MSVVRGFVRSVSFVRGYVMFCVVCEVCERVCAVCEMFCERLCEVL